MLVEIERRGDASLIVLSRPEKLNAINLEMLADLADQFSKAEKEDTRVIVITGYGKNFSAGADINMLASFDPASAYSFRLKMNSIAQRIRKSDKPVIALLKGYSMGGGLELAESADIRIAMSDAVIGQPESSIGINAGAGGNVILPKLVGRGSAAYLAMSGKKLNAQEAMALGLVDEVVDDEAKAWKIIDDICKKPKKTLQFIKRAINSSYDMGLESAMDQEALYFSLLFTDPEVLDALSKWRK
ncbi:enoyl-CoA hydratase [Thermoplasma volcanium GSS1]|uniref:Enoyl-CoA hydratase n=1 Tax=Thermoplasma volcanium (strain ATCC 51530 / DSM 4299 / JCM 9571 / NBRC 15438 / GSS1) TaxID=273116 RepID=Q97CA4_THEVO|nr:enoyl-CoA hydratase/isomerase family protein [Thermoplasma volcanium]BAB59340.1 enoyl-CoA hydratase [Thermoplasma volcanium GSS1]